MINPKISTTRHSDQAQHLARIENAHRLYCELTAQSLSLRFDRIRLWHDWFNAGFNEDQLRRLVCYLQTQIRLGLRHIGALKLCNILQPDRFEEDLQISRARLRTSSAPTIKSTIRADTQKLPLASQELERSCARGAAILRAWKDQQRRK